MALSAEDRFAIQDLYTRYNTSVDAVDGDTWASCFTEDGSYVPASGSARGQALTGRAELAAFGNDLSRRFTHPSRHWTTNLVLEEAGETVKATCYGLLLDVSEPTPRPTSSIVYHDELVRTDDGWRFHTRRPTRDAID